MALTSRVIVDDPQCLIVCQVDETKQDGAIASIDVTNRTSDRPLVAWAIYSGRLVESSEVNPQQTLTVTFRGASARAGDVSEVGYRI